MATPESQTNRNYNHHDRLDESDNIEQVYPYPAVPRSVRPYLERCFQIDNINRVNPDDEAMLDSLDRLRDINRTLGLVRTYCGTELSGSAYKAAALGEVEDSADGLGDRRQRSIRAAEELGKFFLANTPDGQPVDNEKNVYIAGLLQDRRRLDQFRERARSISDDVDHKLDHEQPSREEWLSDPAITDADTLYQAVENINIESILISGAETLAILGTRPDKPDNDRLTLDLVRYSEQIIAPIAEVIGLDTLAMSLNSTTKSIRLINGGRGYLLHRADAIIDVFRSFNRSHGLAHNVSDAFRDIVGEMLGSVNTAGLQPNIPVDYGNDNRSVYGDTPTGEVQTADGPVNVSWRFRLKTPGSLAWKLFQSEKAGKDISVTPMDILGITAVVNNEDDQVKLFHALANGLYTSDELMPHPAPSKTAAIHIRGMSSYIRRMSDDITGVDGVDTKEVASPDALHYGKVTGYYNKLPFEVQCVTRHFRDSMQVGPLAHIIYKVNAVGKMSHAEVVRWVDLLANIRGRRARLGTPGLVGSYDIDPQTGTFTQGNNERMARQLIDNMTQATRDRNRTVGFIATEPLMHDE